MFFNIHYLSGRISINKNWSSLLVKQEFSFAAVSMYRSERHFMVRLAAGKHKRNDCKGNQVHVFWKFSPCMRNALASVFKAFAVVV